ncbi:mannobiose 2-epimerase [Chitinophaga sp. YR627]|nr:mannobiose 2-epimerase [Chitinophaga sp. YR627]
MLKQELLQELKRILDYWATETVDEINGGFIGRISGHNVKDPYAVKGSVLNARILWTFSAAANLLKTDQYYTLATRAWDYLRSHFADKEHGGLYWTVDYTGKVVDSKKQVYAIAFSVYACSEYFKASGNEEAKQTAIGWYRDIRRHAYDNVYGGYIEACTANWQPLSDLRLSLKDANERKSMNTHLHVLEAWTTLYEIWPDEQLKADIQELLLLFDKHIIHPSTHHLQLFFADDWTVKSTLISYGHDIEAAWLLQEAAVVIGDEQAISRFSAQAINLVRAALKGMDKDGGLWYEYNTAEEHLITEKHWWPQAEALVGLINAWELSGDQYYLDKAMASWQFIQQFLLDKKDGEWYWGVGMDGLPMDEVKVGLWKCPYHNARACMEVVKRLK